MIEEIKMLLPLLEKATNGAIWGVGMYFGFHLLVSLMWFGGFAFFVSKSANLIKMAVRWKESEVDLRTLTYEGEVVARYIGEKGELEEFFKWAAEASPSGWIYSSDLRDIREGKRGK